MENRSAALGRPAWSPASGLLSAYVDLGFVGLGFVVLGFVALGFVGLGFVGLGVKGRKAALWLRAECLGCLGC